MPYVYRRPFDTAQHRQAFNYWTLTAALESSAASGAFETYAATLTVTAGANEQGTRATRFSARGVYRARWPYAEHQARINLFYTDAQDISAIAGSGGFVTYSAAVQLGPTSGATISATRGTSSFFGYSGAITGAYRNPISDAIGQLDTYIATVTATYGLGESRTGSVPARGSGNYRPARVNVKGRSGRKVSGLKELVKRK